MSGLLETLQSGGHILGDGAMGTMLQDAGLTDVGAPEVMAEWATVMRDMGIDVIGACCGSTPEHIAAMRPIVLG